MNRDMFPFISVVVGSSIDAKITLGKGISSKSFASFVSKKLNKEFHKLRHAYDAILVSVNTVLTDNPSLTVRGIKGSKNRPRIVLDSSGRIPLESKILNEEAPTLLLTTKKGSHKLKRLDKKNTKIIVCKTKNKRVDLIYAFKKLRKLKIKRLLIEGGGTLNAELFKEDLVNELKVFVFPIIIGGIDTPTIVDGKGLIWENKIKKMKLKETKKIGDCVVNTYIR